MTPEDEERLIAQIRVHEVMERGAQGSRTFYVRFRPFEGMRSDDS
jgi:hypothetical protein